jgi:lysophospholipase L1-like esterase
MALPAEISTFTATVGAPVTHAGGPLEMYVTLEPSAFLIHTASGTPLVDMLEELTLSQGISGQFTLPHTDQDGFQDVTGAAYKNWFYTAKIYYGSPVKRRNRTPVVKVFQATVGQDVVDLDLLPSGLPAMPYTAPAADVSAFNGRTGAVTLEESDLPERLTDAALTATYLDKASGVTKADAAANYRPRAKNTIVHLGDSNTDYGDTDDANMIAHSDRGFTTWSQVLSGHRLEILNNAGIQGERTDQIRARIPNDVIAQTPGFCHVLAGTNDMLQDIPLATAKANLLGIWTDLRNAGIRVIAGTLPPATGLTTSRQAFLYDLNAWIKLQGSVIPDLTVVDYHRTLADPATNGWYSNYALADGLHTSRAGAAAMGKALADAINVLVPPRPRLLATTNDPFGLITNPMLTGNVSGIATGWTHSTLAGSAGTATGSKVARTDGLPGEMQQMVVASGQASAGFTLQAFTPSAINFTPGDTVYATAEIEMGDDIANFQYLTLAVMPTLSNLSGIVPFASDMDPYQQSIITAPYLKISKGILRTRFLVTPVTAARIAVALKYKGEGTIRIGSISLINATKLAARTA